MRIKPALPLLALSLLALGACSEGRPPGAPPPQDSAIVVSFSSDNAEQQGQAEIAIEILGIVAISDGGRNVDFGAPEDEINLVAVDGEPIELVGGVVEPGDFTGIAVEFATEGSVRETPASPPQPMILTETEVTANGDFSVEQGVATEVELILDIDGRLTFDDGTATWELDPRRLDLLN